jgi:hypothetical protein
MNAVFKKLNFKGQPAIYVVNSPDSFASELEEMKIEAKVKTSFAGASDVPFVLAFVTRQKEVDDLAKKLSSLISEDGLLWFAYPKGTSKKYTCEFNRDNGWDELGKLGFEPVRMVAIDDDWSAIRFRRAENIKVMTRRSALSKKGKERIKHPKKAKQ